MKQFAQLGDLAEFVNGVAFRPEDWSDSGARIVRIQNLTDPTKPYNRTRREVATKYHVNRGDLLVSWSATLGVFEWDQPDTALVNQHIFRVVADERRVSKPYLKRALRNALADMERHLHGATMKHVNREEFLRTEISLPPIVEQKRIAAILDAAEALREKRRQTIALRNSLEFAVFSDMFGEPISNPRHWPRSTLEDACEAINDCPHSTPTWAADGVVCLRTSNLTAGGWKWSDTRYVSEAEFRERSRRGFLEEGDVVLSREGTVGIAAIVPPQFKMCMGQRLVQVRPSTGITTSAYLLRYLLYVLDPDRISQFMVGSTSQHLNVKELRALSVPLPPIQLQQSYESRITATIGSLEADQQQAAVWMDNLCASLQHRAFCGEL